MKIISQNPGGRNVELLSLLHKQFKCASEKDVADARREFEWGLDYYRNRIEAIDFHNNNNVLDAACGCGQYSIALAEKNQFVTGLDINPGYIEISQHISSKFKLQNTRFLVGNLHSIPFANESFDAIFCYSALMYTREDRVISEFARVLQPGGSLYICSDGAGWPIYKLVVESFRNKRFRSIIGSIRLILNTSIYNILLSTTTHHRTFLPYRFLAKYFQKNKLKIDYYGPEGRYGNLNYQLFSPRINETFFGLPSDFEVLGKRFNK